MIFERRLAPSILSADFSALSRDVEKVEEGGADLIHVDVMDGHFVPNISYGSTVMKSLLGKTQMPFDVHLMIDDPDFYLESFVTDTTEYITVHQEACPHINRTIAHIKSCGVKAGISLNPGTPIGALESILEEVDMVLLMSVNPGFGGQGFIESTLKKAVDLVQLRERYDLSFDIEMDGGIDPGNLKSVLDSGVNIVVAGSSIFKADDIAGRTREFLNIMKVEK